MNIDRNTAMLRAAKLEEIEQEIRARTPRASVRLHVSLSNPPIRTASTCSCCSCGICTRGEWGDGVDVGASPVRRRRA